MVTAPGRDKRRYQAERLRNGVVHASNDELVVLLGDLAIEPGTRARYEVEYPLGMLAAPAVTVRFVPKARLSNFIGGRLNGTLPIPADFAAYPAVAVAKADAPLRIRFDESRPGRFLQRWQAWQPNATPRSVLGGVDLGRTAIEFATRRDEGAYVILVEWTLRADGRPERFHVVVYGKVQTRFPTAGVDNLTDLIVPAVNLSDKNGLIWFVHPIFFAEQMLRVRLSDAIKQEIAYCEDLPLDLPAEDTVLVGLIWGYELQGLTRVRLAAGEDPDCVDTTPVRVGDAVVDYDRLLRKGTTA